MADGSGDRRTRIDFVTVAAAARGRWPSILLVLGIDGACLLDRHGPCPGCGGRDRYRYDDRDGRGTWYCSGGGQPASGDGFALLGHVHGWSPAESLRRVAEVLGLAEGRALPPVESRAKSRTKDRDHEAGAALAAHLWAHASTDIGDHLYLLNKQVAAHGLRRLGDALVLPLRDIDGKLWSLQFIDASGNKRFLRGARVAGCFHRLARSDGALDVVLIGEGYATCAAAHEATGYAAAVAHSAGNLPAVACALRERYPHADIVLLADDDPAGRTCCERAARAVQGRVALPPEVRCGA